MKNIWLLLFVFFSSQAKEHLVPLGEHGIYYYKDTQELIDEIRHNDLIVEATYLVYPSSGMPSAILVNSTWETNQFSITIAKDISRPELSRTLEIDKQVAERLLEAFDSVIATIRMPDEPFFMTDGTHYVFSDGLYSGFHWGKSKAGPRNITEFIEVLEVLLEQLLSEKDSITLARFDSVLKHFESKHNKPLKQDK